MKPILLIIIWLTCLIFSCIQKTQPAPLLHNVVPLQVITAQDSITETSKYPETLRINKDIAIRTYFKWMDSVVDKLNSSRNYITNEYILVHNNLWILDTLTKTDYYYLKDKGIYNEDSQSLLVLRKDQVLMIPDSLQTEGNKRRLSNTYLDLNIPEFKLRIIQNGQAIYKLPVRVGQNNKRYLAMANREVDLRTKPGIGKIIRVNKNPAFINPKDNHRYHVTRRDDGNTTKLPAIPWIEPAINGVSLGQLIHPTTNLETLEKAYSNGCIGLRESDAWIVYYYAPVDTKVVFRYDLNGKDDAGNTIEFKHIYPGFEKLSIRKEALEAALFKIDGKPIAVCYCHLE